MGSGPTESYVKELEQEAYAALLRAMYVKSNVDIMTLEQFLLQARTQLNIDNDTSSKVFESVKADDSDDGRPLASRAKAKAKQFKAKRPIGAPGGSRPRGRPIGAVAAPAEITPPVSRPAPPRQPTLARPRSTRSMGSVDPQNLVGRRIWRYYPDENPERPWVEGFIFEYDNTTGTYRILYDPNDPGKQESVEEGFSPDLSNPAEYVLGDYFDLETCIGSRRQAHRPTPVALAPPAAVVAPAKRRRSVAIKIPPSVPFPQPWLEGALLEATPDDLHTMLNMLELRERQLEDAIKQADLALVMGDDLERRAQLEGQFEELCKKEIQLMAELTAVKNSEQ